MAADTQQELPWLGQATPEETARIVEALYRVHALVASLTDLDALLLRIIEESRIVARAEASSLLLYDPAREDLYFEVAIGDSGDQEALKRTVRLKIGQGIAGAAAASRSSIIVNDAQTDARFYRNADDASNFRTRNLLAVPMVDRDNLVGVLEAVNRQDGGAFSELDLRALEMFAALAATSVVNARLIEEQIRNERLAAIGLAVTGLSHYTKNIVTGLSSSTDLIEMGLACNNIDVLQRCFPVFKRSVRRISNFVQDMLSFSKPRTPVREHVRLDALIKEAAETFDELFSQKNIALEVDIAAVTQPLHVDAPALYRCLLNLLSNAAYALPGEGGRIVVRARMIDAATMGLDVEDNGPGVPERYREVIFDPFFSTKGSEGTGLGLAVTRKIFEEHGGSIGCIEAPGGGALFRIVLPLTGPPLQQAFPG